MGKARFEYGCSQDTDAYMYTCTSSPSPTTADFEEVENHQSWTASAPRDQFVGRSGPHYVLMQLWHSMQRVSDNWEVDIYVSPRTQKQ